MDFFKKIFSTPSVDDDESERIRRTVTPGAPVPQEKCDDIFSNWTDVQVLPSDSASPTVMVLFKKNNRQMIAKMWFPALKTHWPDMLQALASETYIYKHQIPMLLGTLAGYPQRTPCLVAAKHFPRCRISLKNLKGVFARYLNKYPRNMEHFEARFGNEQVYSKKQDEFRDQPVHMIVSGASTGQKFQDWIKEWSRGVSGATVKDIPIFFDALNNLIFQVIWTLTQLHRVCVVHNDLHLGNIFVEQFAQPLRNEYYESWEEQGCGWLFPETYFRALIYDWDRSAVLKVIGNDEPPFNPLTSLTWDKDSKKWMADTFCCSYGQCQDHRPAADLYFFAYQMVDRLETFEIYVDTLPQDTRVKQDFVTAIKIQVANTIAKLNMVSPDNQTIMTKFGGRQEYRPSAVSKFDPDLLMENSSFGINDPIETVLQKAWSRYYQRNRPTNVGNVYKGLSPDVYQCNTHALDRIGTMCQFFEDEPQEDKFSYKAGANPKTYGFERANDPFSCNPKRRSEKVPTVSPSRKLKK